MSPRRAPHRLLLIVAASLAVSAFTASSAGAVSPPLGAGQLHHTFTISFPPNVPKVAGIRYSDPGYGTVPFTSEEWYAANGSGRTISSGGAYSHRYAPKVTRDASGRIIGIGGNSGLQPETSRMLSLALANTVSLVRRSIGKPVVLRSWVRQARGYEQSNRQLLPVRWAVLDLIWGASYAELSALPDSGPELDTAMAKLIEDVTLDPQGELPTGAWGETVATQRTERQIQHALRLLGHAPLSAADRRAVIHWLERQQFAVTTTDERDFAGRHGTRLKIARINDTQVPARTVTAKQLVEEARAAGSPDAPDTTSTKSWDVAAHREYRRFIVDIVYDNRSGRLLQSYGFTQKFVDVDVPFVVFAPDKPTRSATVAFRLNQGGTIIGGMLEADLYFASEEVSKVVPRTPVCARQPKLCR